MNTDKDSKILSPYAYSFEHTDVERHSKKDFTTIKDFIGEKKDFGQVLDIGDENPVSEKLSSNYNINISQTDIDLDIEKLNGTFDTVFCFEVVEHLFNPLHLLLEINKVLVDGGTLYLSTPKRRPHFMWYKYHFHEFSKEELENLINRAGFKIKRMDYKMSGRPLIGYFRGIRPILRLFLERKCLLEIIKV
ncbi:MAG: methyltransferase domain-containing protein [Candidatus Marinimicrobia bacterium]|jgi:SAM-dependent methyltransferase|nr:methyltransferase domain-containing protein [Candidatus Neomarinimicrobiota bacterium]MBT4280473.1 methyltransferase domain-containing protein [Candidatus Neomarinimicrobiota bacterium]MBT4956412.1 methyltransferase domain-containing protein [Candidatus Neomarinimicrobiota bacterium]MBT7900182.1 methyltransferase domain-containing protein [Candidatus Neomarinimicrobiota bacterium]